MRKRSSSFTEGFVRTARAIPSVHSNLRVSFFTSLSVPLRLHAKCQRCCRDGYAILSVMFESHFCRGCSDDYDYDIPEGSERSLIQMVINFVRKFSSFCGFGHVSWQSGCLKCMIPRFRFVSPSETVLIMSSYIPAPWDRE